MRIPSYDDLTPSIPDISPGDVLTSAATLLPDGGPVAARALVASSSSDRLFAALHGAAPDRLMAIARDFSPRVERRAGGTIVLDASGLRRLLGEAPAIAADLVRAGAPHVAVATTQIAAILLARARPAATIAIGEPEAALRDVPIGVLQQFLVDISDAAVASPPSSGRRSPARVAAAPDGRVFDVLRRWGLTTIGEFAALPAAALASRLGADGSAIQRLARGIDPRPLVPDPEVRRFTGSFELEWPIDTVEPLSFVFARLLDPLAAALERADRGAVAMHLTLRLTNRTSHMRMLQLPAAMRDPRVLRTLLVLDLESHPPSAAVDIVSIELDPAPARIVQYSLLERAVPSPETLATLMARLGALVGESRCGSPVLLDTHRPDAFAMAPLAFTETREINFQLPTPNCQGKQFARAVCNSAERRCSSDFHPDGSSHVPWQFWELPSSTLRRFRPPVAVRVAVGSGRPVRVAIDRRGMPGGVVTQAAGPWRASGGWWESGRWNRDEWDLALGDGSVCRFFRDRDRDQWFLDGVYD